MKFSIIIPCYNEGKNIHQLLTRITPLQDKYNLEYILVENGSVDNSKSIFQSEIEGDFPNVSIVYVPKNIGYGYGIQQGLLATSGDYIGWIHADMQMPPEELYKFFDDALSRGDDRFFFKGVRTNRSSLDMFFTNGQSLVNSIMFRQKIYDVGAIPVIFHRSLLDYFCIQDMPNDFSIELFIYLIALQNNFKIIRHRVKLLDRENGSSSWNTGLSSKIRQAKRIYSDSILIKKGEKVL